MTKVIERHLWEEFREYADEIRHTMEWKMCIRDSRYAHMFPSKDKAIADKLTDFRGGAFNE